MANLFAIMSILQMHYRFKLNFWKWTNIQSRVVNLRYQTQQEQSVAELQTPL